MSELSELFHKCKTLNPESIEERYIKELESDKVETQKTIDKLFQCNQDMSGDNCELKSIIDKLESDKAELIESIQYLINNGVFESGQVRNEICNILNKFKVE